MNQMILLVLIAFAGSPQGDPKPVNAVCPISKEPIVASAGTVEHDGHAIGVCCRGCGRAFLAWSVSRRDAFVETALAGDAPRDPEPVAPAAAPAKSYPYPLDVCIVTGEKLGSMGDPIVMKHDGREVRFCCSGCVRKFEADAETSWKKIDEKIVAQQLMHYPVDTCIVAGGTLGSMGDPVNHVHNNRLVRFCCAGCIPGFEENPGEHLAKLDAQIAKKQTETYPLDECVVMGAALGSMGDPADYVFGNRLVRFCCAGCSNGFEKDPAGHMAKIDKAYADAQRAEYPLDTCVVAGSKLGSMGEPYEIVAGTRLVRFCCKGCLPAFAKDPAAYLSKLGGRPSRE